MKKTSVDQLTKAGGIAKGSFYKFFESKEMLFFAVLENIHSELYRVADNALSEADSLPPPERAAKAVLAVCQRLSDTGDMVFIENDAKLLLQRLPENVKNVHYHDDETHIRQLLEKYDNASFINTSEYWIHCWLFCSILMILLRTFSRVVSYGNVCNTFIRLSDSKTISVLAFPVKAQHNRRNRSRTCFIRLPPFLVAHGK